MDESQHRERIPKYTVRWTGLRAEMARVNVSRQDLAEFLGVHPNTVSNWQRGRTVPDTALVVRALVYLGYTLDEVLDLPLRALISVVESE